MSLGQIRVLRSVRRCREAPSGWRGHLPPLSRALLHACTSLVPQVFSKVELELVASLCRQHDVLCISDEVYQWLVYDTNQHISIGEPPAHAPPWIP